MSDRRCLGPDLLDQLPADDPRAVRSRRDIKIINTIMGQPGIMAHTLLRHCPHNPRLLMDLGSGDGTFMLRVARRLASRWQRVHVILLDRVGIVSEETRRGFKALGWEVETVADDVFAYLQRQRSTLVDVITANLFIHHFPSAELTRLLALVAASTRTFVACEPRRGLLPSLGSRMLWAVGCSPVSVQDSIVGVRAGFRDNEISASWPRDERWATHESKVRLFSHCFAATRLQG